MIDALRLRARQRTGVVSRWAARLRVRHWAHFLVLPIATVPLHEVASSPLRIARGGVIAALVLAFGYLLNGLADAGLDHDTAKNPYVTEPAHPAHARVVSALAVMALALALSANLVVTAATSLALAAGWAYSAGPRLKRFPVVGTLLNVGCFAPLLFVGAAATGSAGAPAVALAFIALLLGNQLLHEGMDAAEDAAGGVRSTFGWLGPRGIAVVVALLGLVAALAVGWGTGSIALAAVTGVAFAVVFPLATLRAGRAPDALARLRGLHRWASGLTGAALYLLSASH